MPNCVTVTCETRDVSFLGFIADVCDLSVQSREVGVEPKIIETNDVDVDV